MLAHCVVQWCHLHGGATHKVTFPSADEVQTGFGRLGGDCWWAFEQQADAVPDIVTVGKPFGNGMPLAAVICRREVAASFAKGPEYFNTFGGNPVCCAAGLAVLDTIEAAGLREHATRVGAYFKDRLAALAASPAGRLIGNVRGQGTAASGTIEAPLQPRTSLIQLHSKTFKAYSRPIQVPFISSAFRSQASLNILDRLLPLAFLSSAAFM